MRLLGCEKSGIFVHLASGNSRRYQGFVWCFWNVIFRWLLLTTRVEVPNLKPNLSDVSLFPDIWISRSELHGDANELRLGKRTRVGIVHVLKWSKSRRSKGMIWQMWTIFAHWVKNYRCFKLFPFRETKQLNWLRFKTWNLSFCFQIYFYNRQRILWLSKTVKIWTSTRSAKKFFLPLDVA